MEGGGQAGYGVAGVAAHVGARLQRNAADTTDDRNRPAAPDSRVRRHRLEVTGSAGQKRLKKQDGNCRGRGGTPKRKQSQRGTSKIMEEPRGVRRTGRTVSGTQPGTGGDGRRSGGDAGEQVWHGGGAGMCQGPRRRKQGQGQGLACLPGESVT